MPKDNRHSASDPTERFDDASLRLPSLPNRLPMIERIMSQAIGDPMVGAYRDRAQFTFFCGQEPENMGGYDGQLEVVGRCLEWFVFDYFIPAIDATPAGHWYIHHAAGLSEADLFLAQNCLYFCLGIFEITEIVKEEGFVAVDLLRLGQSYPVRESLVTGELQVGQLLLARLFPYQDAYVLSGMATIMAPHATAEIKRFVENGKLVPADILPHLDGVELENLFGRSVAEIEKIEDLTLLHQRLRHYLEKSCPGRLSFAELLEEINITPDPFNVAVLVCDRLQTHCRHEMDLTLAYIMATWFQTHKP